MCLCIEGQAEIRIAEQDIPVWKAIDGDNKSTVMGFQYTPNTTYTLGEALKVEPGACKGWTKVEKGFHAYVVRGTFASSDSWSWNKYVSFTIPKGAHYIIGEFGDCVADTIISGDLVHLR